MDEGDADDSDSNSTPSRISSIRAIHGFIASFRLNRPMTAITISKRVTTAVRISPHVMQAAAMFGLGVDQTQELTIVPQCEIPLPHLGGKSGIIFITGPSGSGKSMILRLIAEQCIARGIAMLNATALPALPDLPLVDALHWPGATLQRVMELLSMAGLGDAFVMLRRPCELSDGQRFRLTVAHAMAQSFIMNENGGVILFDEFASSLDRLCASAIARNIRRWIDNQPPPHITLIAATTHDDLLEPLQPDVLVWKGLGDQIEVVQR